MKRLIFSALSWGLLLGVPLAFSGQSLSAQETAAESGTASDPLAEAGVLFESVDTHVVNVEVYLTDKKTGLPVTDLKQEDFRLLEDGRPMTITNFYKVVGGRPSADSTPSGGASPAPTESADGASPATTDIADREALLPRAGAAEQVEVPASQRLHVILYFDNLFLEPFSRRRAIIAVRRFIADHLSPGDQAMVATYERTLHIRQPFTQDPNLILDALDEVETLTGFGRQAKTERDRVLKIVENAKSYREAEQFSDFHAKEIFSDLGRSIDGLKEMVEPLAGLEGRKMIVYVSDGLPMKAGAAFFEMIAVRFGKEVATGFQAQRYDARRRFKELVASANSNRVTLYTLEAAGLRSHESLSSEFRSSADGGSRISFDLTRTFNYQEPLQMMAYDTGGLAALNTNNLTGLLDRVGTDISSFYSLGFSPTHFGDGRIHDIEVEVTRDDVELRHRRSYRDKTREHRTVESVLSVLRFGGGNNDLEVGVSLGRPSVEEEYYLVPVTVSVPFSKVTFLPLEGQHIGRLNLVIAVIDDEGATSQPEVASLPLAIPNDQMTEVLKHDVVYEAQLRMRGGIHRLAVGVRDDLSGRLAVERKSFRIGE